MYLVIRVDNWLLEQEWLHEFTERETHQCSRSQHTLMPSAPHTPSPSLPSSSGLPYENQEEPIAGGLNSSMPRGTMMSPMRSTMYLLWGHGSFSDPVSSKRHLLSWVTHQTPSLSMHLLVNHVVSFLSNYWISTVPYHYGLPLLMQTEPTDRQGLGKIKSVSNHACFLLYLNLLILLTEFADLSNVPEVYLDLRDF